MIYFGDKDDIEEIRQLSTSGGGRDSGCMNSVNVSNTLNVPSSDPSSGFDIVFESMPIINLIATRYTLKANQSGPGIVIGDVFVKTIIEKNNSTYIEITYCDGQNITLLDQILSTFEFDADL